MRRKTCSGAWHLVGALVAAVLVGGCFQRPFDAGEALQDLLVRADPAGRVSLADAAPFEWERAVFLRSYMSSRQVDLILGFEAGLTSAFEDGTLTVIFIDEPDAVVRLGQLGDHLFRFDGTHVTIDRDTADLEVHGTGDGVYATPVGTGPRGLLCGPDGLEECE